MYLMYVDETGDTGVKLSPTSYFGLSALIVHESQWRIFVNQLVALRKTLRSIYSLPVRTELHAVEFINHRVAAVEKGNYIARHDRLAILRNTVDEMAKMDYISITSVIVEKARKTSPDDVFNSAWSVLFQRFENTMTHGNFPGGFKRSHGMVITDATAGSKLFRMVRRMSVYNPVPNSSGYPGGFRNIPIVRIIEDPHGKDSADSLPIQMCDIAAYFLHQRFNPNSYVRRQKAQNYYDRLLPVLNTHASRNNRFGIVQL